MDAAVQTPIEAIDAGDRATGGELRTRRRFTVRDGKVSRLDTGQA